ncbi:hypothetical protein BpHYR1_033128 [Brachionus plicatilis]|uniref:Uncharacterized protein n=1 Tax=Brachionus plicatilis TaxID=10195 RepID=A0A3M7PVP5_BRAPC|nr:hypothetical protein BpHYR1_033128 [Brachionus plicatilis]
MDRENKRDFIFKTQVGQSNNVWSSFAFSFDSIMGHDNGIACKIFNSQHAVEHFYSSGKFRPNLLSELDPTIVKRLCKLQCNEIAHLNFLNKLSELKIEQKFYFA